jgi:hypothetical protein
MVAEPNDYVVSKPDLTVVPGIKKGKTRIFVVDDIATPAGYSLKLTQLGVGATPSDLQVWYEGSRKLRLSNDVHALVYAPNATVEIPFNSRFAGAIVANRIIGEGNNTYSCDIRMINTEYKQDSAVTPGAIAPRALCPQHLDKLR